MTALAWRNEDTSFIYRVGYQPEPFAWTLWQYATDGRFQGRWDGRNGRLRTLYVADRLLGCVFEVLAYFRPDLAVLAGLGDIDGLTTMSFLPLQARPCPSPGWLSGRQAKH